jgi:GNAT superfamily N-acetyltransferase
MVRTDGRGRGARGALLQAFEERCWAAGCHKLTLHTQKNDVACPFYEHRGWHTEAHFRQDFGGYDYVRLVRFRATHASKETNDNEHSARPS